MIKHTTLNIDVELVSRAREVLGTKGTTDTVHRALEEVINRCRRERLVQADFSELIESLDKLRAPRHFSDEGPG
jgi:Arc/MetJ family transcription regulator